MRSKINGINLRSEPLLIVEGMALLLQNQEFSCWRNLFKDLTFSCQPKFLKRRLVANFFHQWKKVEE